MEKIIKSEMTIWRKLNSKKLKRFISSQNYLLPIQNFSNIINSHQ